MASAVLICKGFPWQDDSVPAKLKVVGSVL